ncbi:MAG: LamG domain-containing protein [Candidatus Komeilibacteria bacterium]
MLNKIKNFIIHNLLTSVVVALIVVGFIVSIGLAVGGGGGGGTITAGDINKGLVFHAPLNSESEKVGSELVTNGGFDSSTGWGAGTAWSIANGVASYDDSGTSILSQNNVFTVGKSYIIKFTISNSSGNGGYIAIYSDASGVVGYTYYTDGTYVVQGTANGTQLRIYGSSGGSSFDIDDVSVKEIQTADTTPNANHGTVYGATQNTDDMSFDGTDDYVDVEDSNILDIQVIDGISISAWIKPVNTTASDTYSSTNPQYIVIKGAAPLNSNYWFRILGQKLNFGWRNSANDGYNTKDMDSHNLTNNEWQHVLVIHDGSDIIFYIDGVEQASSVSSGSMTDESISNSDLLYIGVEFGNSQRYFNGSIKDFRIYNRALSATEVKSLYDLGGRQNQISTGSLYKGLVLDMPLNSESEKVGSNIFTSNNPNFESDTNSPPVYWYNTGTHVATAVVDATSPNGSNVMEIVASGTGSFSSNAVWNGFFKYGRLVSGKSYRLIFYAKSISGSTIISGRFQSISIPNWTITTDWERYEYDFIGNGGTYNELYFLSASGAATFRIDNILVKELQTADTTPNANHGTVYGATQNADTMSFDGDDYVKIDNILLADNFSISFNYTPDTIGSSREIIDIGKNAFTYENFRLGLLSNGGTETVISDTSSTRAFPTSFPAGTFTSGIKKYIAVTYDGTNFRNYADGTLISTSANVSFASELVSTYLFTRNGATNFNDGSLQDVRIYNRALSADEVKQLYDLGGRQNQVSTGSLYKGLVLDMPLNSESEKVGSELVTNGDIASSGVTDNWTAVNSTLTAENNGLKVSDNGSYSSAYQLINTVVGKKYRLTFDAEEVSGGFFVVYTSSTAPDGTSYGDTGRYVSSSTGRQVIDFISTTTTLHIIFASQSTDYAIYNNISFREIQTADTTPNANHGIVHGATVGSDSTSFDGTDDYIQIPSNSNLDLQYVSVSAWVKYATGGIIIVNKYNTQPGTYTLYKDSITNKFSFHVRLDGSEETQRKAEANDVVDTEWHHVVGTYDGSIVKLYVDYILQDTIDSTSGVIDIDNSNILGIGYRPVNDDQFWNGQIKDVRIYNRALSADEVKLLYDKGR